MLRLRSFIHSTVPVAFLAVVFMPNAVEANAVLAPACAPSRAAPPMDSPAVPPPPGAAPSVTAPGTSRPSATGLATGQPSSIRSGADLRLEAPMPQNNEPQNVDCREDKTDATTVTTVRHRTTTTKSTPDTKPSE